MSHVSLLPRRSLDHHRPAINKLTLYFSKRFQIIIWIRETHKPIATTAHAIAFLNDFTVDKRGEVGEEGAEVRVKRVTREVADV